MLTNYLLGREPIRDFPHSNGHGRTALAGAPRPQISNLIFKAEHSVPFDELKKKLIQMCKDQGRPYGYFVETTGPQLSPRLAVANLRERRTSGTSARRSLQAADTRALRSDIVATGNDNYVYNRAEPLPSAIVAPSILFGELDIQRANRTREKLPQYPAPALSSATASR